MSLGSDEIDFAVNLLIARLKKLCFVYCLARASPAGSRQWKRLPSDKLVTQVDRVPLRKVDSKSAAGCLVITRKKRQNILAGYCSTAEKGAFDQALRVT